jgi:DNA polymerase-4
MFDLCEGLTPWVQRNSIDEGYLDLAPCGLRDRAAVEAAVRGLQERIRAELSISVSFGLATNKLVSQIASKLRKPRGFVVVPPGEEAAFLAPLAVGKLPGIGAKTEEVLASRGVRLIQDIVARSPSELRALFGEGWREMAAAARGEDDRPVETEPDDAKSYSQQETFAVDLSDPADVERIAKGMIDELMPKIRADGKRVRTLTGKVRSPDFSQASHAHSLVEATDLETPFYAWIGPLLRAAWTRRSPLRLVSVRFSNVAEPESQLEMFAETEDRRRRLAGVLDALNRGGVAPRVKHGHQLARPADPGGADQG